MKKITLVLFIILFCFGIGVAQELSDAQKKDLEEFLRSKGYVITSEEQARELEVRKLMRQNLEKWGLECIPILEEELEKKFRKHGLDWRTTKPGTWIKEEEKAWRLECLEQERKALLRKQEEENTRLQYLIWELDAVKSGIRMERDFMETHCLFMPYLQRSLWFHPLPTRYSMPRLELTPSINPLWLYLLRR